MADTAAALLASGDVDALRLHLQSLNRGAPAGAGGPSDQGGGVEPAAEALAERGIMIADDILRRGLPHLERAAAAEAQQAQADASATSKTFVVAQLGLTLLEHSVMGQVVWPAALALGLWLQARADELCRGARVLELGAGAGVPGLVACAAGASHLLLTEGDDSLVQLMAANCEANAPAGSTWAAALLDWREAEAVAQRAGEGGGWDMVLAADVLYSAGDIQPLVGAAAALLRRTPRSRFLLACSAWFGDLEHPLLANAEAAGLRLTSREELAAAAAPGEQRPVVLEFVVAGAAERA